MQDFISKKAIELKIKPENITITKSAYNGWHVKLRYHRKIKEDQLNKMIIEEHYRRILDDAVKEKYSNWSEFNKIVNKSHRNKYSLIKSLVNIEKMLNKLNLRIKIEKK